MTLDGANGRPRGGAGRAPRWLGAGLLLALAAGGAGCLRVPDNIRDELRPSAVGHYGPPPGTTPGRPAAAVAPGSPGATATTPDRPAIDGGSG